MPRRSTIRLTKRSVDALSPASKDTVFWDRDLAGFGVRALWSGRKVFTVQSRGPGGSKRVSLGRPRPRCWALSGQRRMSPQLIARKRSTS